MQIKSKIFLISVQPYLVYKLSLSDVNLTFQHTLVRFSKAKLGCFVRFSNTFLPNFVRFSNN